MNELTEKLKDIIPTKFVKPYCQFWAGAMMAFKNHVPKNHLSGDSWSIEAVDAFKQSFREGYEPKVEITDSSINLPSSTI